MSAETTVTYPEPPTIPAETASELIQYAESMAAALGLEMRLAKRAGEDASRLLPAIRGWEFTAQALRTSYEPEPEPEPEQVPVADVAPEPEAVDPAGGAAGNISPRTDAAEDGSIERVTGEDGGGDR